MFPTRDERCFMADDSAPRPSARPPTRPPTRPLRYPKQRRVVRSNDFTRAIRHGTVAADGTLVVFVVASTPDAMPKMGVTIPKRTGNAVKRNQWKRLIRESFRTQQHDMPRGFDIVVRPKKDAIADWQNVQRSLPRLVAKAIRRTESSRR